MHNTNSFRKDRIVQDQYRLMSDGLNYAINGKEENVFGLLKCANNFLDNLKKVGIVLTAEGFEAIVSTVCVDTAVFTVNAILEHCCYGNAARDNLVRDGLRKIAE